MFSCTSTTQWIHKSLYLIYFSNTFISLPQHVSQIRMVRHLVRILHNVDSHKADHCVLKCYYFGYEAFCCLVAKSISSRLSVLYEKLFSYRGCRWWLEWFMFSKEILIMPYISYLVNRVVKSRSGYKCINDY